MHIVKRYLDGIGHIETRDGRLLVSFYGRRVAQQETDTLPDARRTLAQMAQAETDRVTAHVAR